jgi:oligopeptidase B
MSRPKAPTAHREPVARTLHGETIVDPYAWMRERDSDRFLAHVRAENEYAHAALAHLADLRETVFGEIRSRIRETDLSVPARRGDYGYLTRTQEGKQYPTPLLTSSPSRTGPRRCCSTRTSSPATRRTSRSASSR